MKDWKKIVGQLAPTVATALGGPMAGVATRFIAGAVLGNKDASEGEIEAAILSADPDTLAKVREIDAKFKSEMARVGVDLERIASGDRHSARILAIANGMWPQICLSVLFIGGYFGLLFALFSGTLEITGSVRDVSNILLGVISAGVPMILRFWFGGSIHDQDNMEKIYQSRPEK